MMALCVNPAHGREQARVGRHAAARRDRAHLRRRRGHASAGGRTRSARSPIAAPQLMTGYWNRPDETAIVLRDHVVDGVDAALAAHRRPRLSGRGRLSVHRRSEEGSDQDERLPGVAARDRRGDRRASGGRRGRRGRRRRRDQGRSGEGVGGAARRDTPVIGSRAARVLPRAARALQGAGAASSSAASCRRRWSARCCGAR